MTANLAVPLPPGWIRVPVSAIADVRLGRQRSPKNHSGPNMRPYLRAANMTWDGFDLTDVNRMNFGPAEFPTYRLHKGDILLSEASGSPSEVGKPAVWNDAIPDCCFQNTLIRVRTTNLSAAYLCWHFYYDAYTGHFGDASRGVGIHHLGADGLSNWEIAVPTLREQARIVAELDRHFTRLDAAVAALKRVQVQLRRYRASVLKAAVKGRLVATEAELARREGRPFESGQELRLRILRERQDASIPNNTRRGTTPTTLTPVSPTGMDSLPEGWTWATVDELADAVTYGTSAKTDEAGGGVPILRMGNLVDGRLVLDTLKFLPADHAEFPALLLHNGDLLFNRTNSAELVGKTAVFHGMPTPCSFASYLIRVRFCTSFQPEFGSIWLNSVFGRAWVKSVAVQQVGQANVNGSKLRALAIPLPPENEQRRVVLEVQRLLSIVEAQREAVANALGRAGVLRRSVLHHAFVGTLVPQDPSDEPAAALLERIRAEREAAATTTKAKTRKPRNPRPTSSVEFS